jgi:hypothetical protein
MDTIILTMGLIAFLGLIVTWLVLPVSAPTEAMASTATRSL